MIKAKINRRKIILFPVLFLFAFTPLHSQNKLEAIIVKMQNAMGGIDTWQKIAVIKWTFDSRQTFYWDKHKNTFLMHRPKQRLLVCLNTDSKTGKVWQAGKAVTKGDSLSHYLNNAYASWINDSYWLAMPFKLNDPGVVLEYLGKDTVDHAHKVAITFESDIGLTPKNKYVVWIDREDSLIKKWAFYLNRNDYKPLLVNNWSNYQKFNDVLLSLDREDYKITNVKILDALPHIESLYEK